MIGLLGKVLRRLAPHRAAFLLAIALTFLAGALEAAKPWPLKIVVDHVLGETPPPWPALRGIGREALLAAACAALVLVYAALGGLGIANNLLTIRIGQRMVQGLRADLYAHIQRLSLAFHVRRPTGELIHRVASDTLAIQTIAMNCFFPVISSAVLLASMVAVMLGLHWQLTLVALGVVPLLVAAVAAPSRRVAALGEAAGLKDGALFALAGRALGAIRVVQAFTAEEVEQRRFVESSRASLDAWLRLYLAQSAYAAIASLVTAVGMATVLWLGASAVLAGRLGLGDLLVFFSYLGSLYAPIASIVYTFGQASAARAGAARVFDLLATAPDVGDGPRPLALGETRGEVAIEDVSFRYAEGGPVLEGVTLCARPGETVAIVGPTGAGKTTLVSLIPRFFDPRSGRVLLDGVDVRELRLRDLRRAIALVLQPPVVFPTTIRENVAYGRPEATAAEIERAVGLADLDEFVARLPRGLETVVGEGGATLSAGEQLRLTIARAILRDAPVLILDEPTAALDAESEARVVRALEGLARGRTTFVIAHRLSTVRRADRVVVLEGGRIVEEGPFEELRARASRFAEMHEAQLGRGAGSGAP